jgi:phage baseplate assembly protein W
MERTPPRQRQQTGIENLRVPNFFRRPKVEAFYRGPGLPYSNTDQIEPPEKVDIDLIFDSIRQIVETHLGERLLEPEFGSRVLELVGEPITKVFEYKVFQFLTEALINYEQRARIRNVYFDYIDNHAHIVYDMELIKTGIVAQGTLKIPREI